MVGQAVGMASEEVGSCSVAAVEEPGIAAAEEQSKASAAGTCPAMAVQEEPCADHTAAGSLDQPSAPWKDDVA